MEAQERLIPVTSEAQLRPGDLVVLTGCRVCGGSHRRLLVKRITDDRYHCRTCLSIEKWECLPVSPCRARTCNCRSIPEGRLFQVDTGLDLARDAADMALLESQAELRLAGVIR